VEFYNYGMGKNMDCLANCRSILWGCCWDQFCYKKTLKSDTVKGKSKRCNGRIRNKDAVGQTRKILCISNIMTRNGECRYTTIINYLRFLFWKVFKRGFPGNEC